MESQLHIFCDESGGMEADKHSFIVTAVSIAPHDATRLMKTFKKAIKAKDEPKGSLLSIPQRTIMFDLLAKEAEHSAVAVTCSKHTPFGKWVGGTFCERDVYAAMLAETCLKMPHDNPKIVNVVADSGRYSGKITPEVKEAVTSALAPHRAWQMNIAFADSRQHPGIQIADIVGNTIYQLLQDGHNAILSSDLLHPLLNKGKLLVEETTINGKKPEWL